MWFSRRLHHAAVRFVTDNGHDESAYEKIFEERYGVTTHIDDYWSLTAPTGNESRHNFQKFHAEEILLLINMLEGDADGDAQAGGHALPGAAAEWVATPPVPHGARGSLAGVAVRGVHGKRVQGEVGRLHATV